MSVALEELAFSEDHVWVTVATRFATPDFGSVFGARKIELRDYGVMFTYVDSNSQSGRILAPWSNVGSLLQSLSDTVPLVGLTELAFSESADTFVSYALSFNSSTGAVTASSVVQALALDIRDDGVMFTDSAALRFVPWQSVQFVYQQGS